MRFLKTVICLFLYIFLFPINSFAKDDVTILLMYAGWHADSPKLQMVLRKLVDSYGCKVDYYLCNIEEPEKCKYVKKHKVEVPKKIPSVMIFINDELIFQKFYDGGKLENFTKPLNSLILSHL